MKKCDAEIHEKMRCRDLRNKRYEKSRIRKLGSRKGVKGKKLWTE